MYLLDKAATFGWLCVETLKQIGSYYAAPAATFGWLCVETDTESAQKQLGHTQPPSGGCVLKHVMELPITFDEQAATFGWLCVETNQLTSVS